MIKSKQTCFKLSPQKSLNETIKAFNAFLTTVNSVVSMRVYYCILEGDFDRISTIEVNPFFYNDVIQFRDDLQCISFFKKCVGIPSKHDAKANAMEKWFEAEESCRQFNESLDIPNWARDELLHHMRKIISSILGEFCPNELFEKSRWGPGSTTTVRGCDTSSHRKFNEKAEVTSGAIRFVSFAKHTGYYPHWDLPSMELTDRNRLLFVPKTTKTDRPISVEPAINSFFQLGVGSMIRRRLGRVGIDLNNGQDLHRFLVTLGSRNKLVSTIDLSSASDTISKRLVSQVLPDDWFCVLAYLRSPNTELPNGVKIPLEKFSSMGNGFTFELETLIFYAAVMATYKLENLFPDVVHVYGDDIIVDTIVAAKLVTNLETLGFTINKEKTFIDGNFKESCGCDVFMGTDVRPYFLKGLPIYEQEIYQLVNGIRAASCRSYSLLSYDISLLPHRLRNVPWLRAHRNPTEMVRFCCSRYKPWYEATIKILSQKKKLYYVDKSFSDGEGVKIPSGVAGRVTYLASVPKQLVRSQTGISNSTLYDNENGGSQNEQITLRKSNFHVVKRRTVPWWDSPFADWV